MYVHKYIIIIIRVQPTMPQVAPGEVDNPLQTPAIEVAASGATHGGPIGKWWFNMV